METPEPLLAYFRFAHLPPPLRDVSMRFAALAADIVTLLPRSAERTVALRKLLEAKDAAVRSAIPPTGEVTVEELRAVIPQAASEPANR